MALLVFADHADDDGSNTWPSAETIAFEGRMSRSTAVEARKRLERDGRIERSGTDPNGSGSPRYTVRMEAAAEGPPPARRRPRRGSDSGRGRIPDGGSDSDVSRGPESGPEPSKENRPTEEPLGTPPNDVDRCWEGYLEAMGDSVRKRELPPDEAAIIRSTLRVGSIEEVIIAFRACARSDYHMKRGKHANRKGGRYNSIGKILKPRPTKGETWRSRLDWWLDRAEEGPQDDDERYAAYTDAVRRRRHDRKHGNEGADGGS